MAVELSKGFKTSRIYQYDGIKDPVDHAMAYNDVMKGAGYSDAEQCCGFPRTLT